MRRWTYLLLVVGSEEVNLVVVLLLLGGRGRGRGSSEELGSVGGVSGEGLELRLPGGNVRVPSGRVGVLSGRGGGYTRVDGREERQVSN